METLHVMSSNGLDKVAWSLKAKDVNHYIGVL